MAGIGALPSTVISCSSASTCLPRTPAVACPGRQQLLHSTIPSQMFTPSRISSTVRCCDAQDNGEVGGISFGRRKGLMGIAAAGWGSLALADVAQAREVEVGTYLPAAPSNSGFVQFKASNKDTPALRAGNVQPYQFVLPPTWKQARVANILSGNYCQPKCAEPWVEVKFEDEKQGTVQVVASPMVRLTNKPNSKIEEIGSPEKLISALGPFVTGNSYDPDEVVETHVEMRGNQTYYTYTLETPYARTGTHNLATATAKGSVVLLFVVSANDTQWSTSEAVLKTVLDSFQV